MKIATDIKTEDWNRIIEGLIGEGWKMKNKYLGFDAGIDYDYLVLKKGDNSIQFAWGNWFEGEIKCPSALMDMLQEKFNLRFTFGESIHLKSSEVKPTKIQSLVNWFRRSR